jgi:hypothetical protein
VNYAQARRRETISDRLMPPLIVSWIWLLIWGGDSLLAVVARLVVMTLLAIATAHNIYHFGYRRALEEVSRAIREESSR